ncbi:MAG: hypothetical protein HC837_20305, partial [Chloroflexaceae bacterium]|nr:hypothetical protein [Chloroflexaceae bacterium]
MNDRLNDRLITQLARPDLSSFVPMRISQRVALQRSDRFNASTLPAHPTAERLLAVVLFADISGFTALTEHMARQGPDGAEMLSTILNDYFDQFIEIMI